MLLAVIAFALVFLSGCIEEPPVYFCGHSIFGGSIESMDPATCDEEWEIIIAYKPLCEELVQNHSPSWQGVCNGLEKNDFTCYMMRFDGEEENYCDEQIKALEEQAATMSEEETTLALQELCKELAPKIEPNWEMACAQILWVPENICTNNMEMLGILLTEPEHADCLQRVESIQQQIETE